MNKLTIKFNGKEKTEVLNLSQRANNCLKRLKITTLEELADKIDMLGSAKGTGVKTIVEIKSSLFDYALSTMTDDEVKEAILEQVL